MHSRCSALHLSCAIQVAIELIIGGAAQVVAELQNRGALAPPPPAHPSNQRWLCSPPPLRLRRSAASKRRRLTGRGWAGGGAGGAGDAFWKEFDFVVAGVATCLLANFAAVYLSAPTVVASAAGAAAAGGGGSALARFLGRCPDNAFQTVLAGGAPYTLLQVPPRPLHSPPLGGGTGIGVRRGSCPDVVVGRRAGPDGDSRDGAGGGGVRRGPRGAGRRVSVVAPARRAAARPVPGCGARRVAAAASHASTASSHPARILLYTWPLSSNRVGRGPCARPLLHPPSPPPPL
jgi:hypothetical protein